MAFAEHSREPRPTPAGPRRRTKHALADTTSRNSRVAGVGAAKLIETVYWEARRRGGQAAQLDFELATNERAAAFEATAEDVRRLRARGAFFPEGTRTSLFTLAQKRAASTEIADTQRVQVLLGRPPRWEVTDDHSLDFEFVARELTTMASVAGGRRVWLSPVADRHLSLDALLVNAEERTPS